MLDTKRKHIRQTSLITPIFTDQAQARYR